MLSIADALDDPALFGPWFLGPSWDTWRAILKAAFALPMSDRELALFRSVAERDPPKKRVRELWIIGGRRGGKDQHRLAHRHLVRRIRRTMRAVCARASCYGLCLAVDRDQARIVLNYTKAYFERIDMLRGLVTPRDDERPRHRRRRRAQRPGQQFPAPCAGAQSPAQFSTKCAFWRDESSASPGHRNL